MKKKLKKHILLIAQVVLFVSMTVMMMKKKNIKSPSQASEEGIPCFSMIALAAQMWLAFQLRHVHRPRAVIVPTTGIWMPSAGVAGVAAVVIEAPPPLPPHFPPHLVHFTSSRFHAKGG